MKESNQKEFISLFKDAYEKCFGVQLIAPLSETESRHFGNTIFEETGLVIGAKSIKNYSYYVIDPDAVKRENPSLATLDTLARYVLNAPYTDEVKRKEKENHFPWWFQYKSKFSRPKDKKIVKSGKVKRYIMLVVAIIIIVLLGVIVLPGRPNDKNVIENFHATQEDSLFKHGWFVKAKDTLSWKRRNEYPSQLTLYTLQGDNWPDSSNTPVIKNLLLRKIPSDCFAVEIHMDNFIPLQNWQQAGILLMEDTTFTSKTVRLSIAYNDFFGGFNKPKEIIIQGVSSGGNNFSKPEEIGHVPVFSIEPGQETLVYNNLANSALRIEKNGIHFRFLYSSAPVVNFAFKEAFSKDLMIKPKYVGLFALQGFVSDTNYIPAHFNFFSLTSNTCGE